MFKLPINSDAHPALIAIVQDNARAALVAGSITNFTDNSTGDAGDAINYIPYGENVAASGSNLAGDTSTDAAAVTVANGIATLAVKLNLANAALGLTALTNSSGGTSGGNTIAAVTTAVTGAATGVQKAGYDAFVASANHAFAVLVAGVNKVAKACGERPLGATVPAGLPSEPGGTSIIGAVTVDLGAAATPGITKAAVDAALTICADNVATIAAKLTACNTAALPSVLAS